MKVALKIHWMIYPFSSRRGMLFIGVISCVAGTLLLLSANTNPSNNVYIGLGYLFYFPAFVQMMDIMYLSREEQASVKCLLLEMSSQNSIFNTGLILQSIIETIACIATIILTMIVSIPFYGFYINMLVVSLWISITSGILCMFFVLAKINNKIMIALVIMFVIFIVFFGVSFSGLFGYTMYIPDYILNAKSLPVLGIIWFLSVPIAIAFGKYCYRTRKEEKQTRFAKKYK